MGVASSLRNETTILRPPRANSARAKVAASTADHPVYPRERERIGLIIGSGSAATRATALPAN